MINREQWELGARFWGALLGVEVQIPDDPDNNYIALDHATGGSRMLIQRAPEAKTSKGRVHLDIETDNLERETQRLQARGATIKQRFNTYLIMQDQCGNEFCVIPPETPSFPDRAKEWQ